MEHFAGLDVSVKETSVCILDDAGKIVEGQNHLITANIGIPRCFISLFDISVHGGHPACSRTILRRFNVKSSLRRREDGHSEPAASRDEPRFLRVHLRPPLQTSPTK